MLRFLYITYTQNNNLHKGKLAQFKNVIHHHSHLLHFSPSQNRHYTEENVVATAGYYDKETSVAIRTILNSMHTSGLIS